MIRSYMSFHSNRRWAISQSVGEVCKKPKKPKTKGSPCIEDQAAIRAGFESGIYHGYTANAA